MASDDNRKLLARLIGSVQSHPRLLAIYWETYLRPRREAFGVLLDQAKARGELPASADTAMLQDMMGGAMLHRLLIDPAPPTAEDLRAYLARLLQQLGLTSRRVAPTVRPCEEAKPTKQSRGRCERPWIASLRSQ